MRCPACNGSIRPQGRFCPLCGAQIFGAGGALPTPGAIPAPHAPTPAPTAPAQTPQQLATAPQVIVCSGAEYAGKTCPFCQFVIKPGDSVVPCPHCEIPHHADCWQENDGCTTFGCAGANAQAAAQPATAAVAARPLGPAGVAAPYARTAPGPYGPTQLPPGPPGPYLGADAPQRLAQLRNLGSWSLGLGIFSLFCCLAFVAPIIGLILGVKALKGYNALRIASDPGRGQAIAGIVCSSVGLLAAIIVVVVQLLGQ